MGKKGDEHMVIESMYEHHDNDITVFDVNLKGHELTGLQRETIPENLGCTEQL